MSQPIYLDDCAYARDLVTLLEGAGHQVVTPRQAGTSGMDDEVHFRYAADHRLVLLTKNPDDFAELHQRNPQHAGLLLVYQDNNPDRDMSHGDIARAIANLESAGMTFTGACHVLNAWRY